MIKSSSPHEEAAYGEPPALAGRVEIAYGDFDESDIERLHDDYTR